VIEVPSGVLLCAGIVDLGPVTDLDPSGPPDRDAPVDGLWTNASLRALIVQSRG
jgi:hypothetical protein